MLAERFDDLRVYQQGFDLAMQVFELSRGWPKEETYSLTSQIRRSSRSVCGNIAEAWRKRRYAAHFVSKLSDADSEAGETQNWLKFARECGYITDEQYGMLRQQYDIVAGGLVKMMASPDSWCGPSGMVREEPVDYDGTV